MDKEAADLMNETKKNGGRIICVGTTSCRTIESAADEQGVIHPGQGDTSIFIYPGYKFKMLGCFDHEFSPAGVHFADVGIGTGRKRPDHERL